MMKDLDGRVIPTINGFKEFDNGGKGSGNWGHAGRPGEIGGSGKGGGHSPLGDDEKLQRARGYADDADSSRVELADREAAEALGVDLSDSGIETSDKKMFWESVVSQLEGKIGKGRTSKTQAKAILDEVAGDVMGGELDDFDGSFKRLISPVQDGKLTRKQVEQLMLDGKPEVTSDKKTIYFATRTKLDSAPTSEKTLKEDLKYYRDYWKEQEEGY